MAKNLLWIKKNSKILRLKKNDKNILAFSEKAYLALYQCIPNCSMILNLVTDIVIPYLFKEQIQGNLRGLQEAKTMCSTQNHSTNSTKVLSSKSCKTNHVKLRQKVRIFFLCLMTIDLKRTLSSQAFWVISFYLLRSNSVLRTEYRVKDETLWCP